MAMLRPAHSLGKLDGAANLGALVDPRLVSAACIDGLSATDCATEGQSIVDMEYRLGTGAGFELGVRGLFPPRALLLKYAIVDERRHRAPLSVGLAAEVGAFLGEGDGHHISFDLVPYGRGDLLLSSSIRVAPGVQLRPLASAGWWEEPRGGLELARGVGFTGGVFVPIRVSGGIGVSPGVGVSAWLPRDRTPELYARLGLQIESWFEPARDTIP